MTSPRRPLGTAYARAVQPAGTTAAPHSAVPTYVISLERSAERRRHIAQQLREAQVPYEIVDAVDGRDIDLADSKLVDPAILTKSWFHAGVVGCALSHIKAYRKALSDGVPYALVLEDDVLVDASLMPLAQAVASNLRGSEVVLLNFHTVAPCKLSTRDTVALPGSRIIAHPLDVHQLTSTGAYLISRGACDRMKDMTPVRCRADEWGYFQDHGALDRVRCVTPLAVRKHPHLRSTIDYHDLRSLHAKLQHLAHSRIPLLYQLLALRRVMIQRRQSRLVFLDQDPPQ